MDAKGFGGMNTFGVLSSNLDIEASLCNPSAALCNGIYLSVSSAEWSKTLDQRSRSLILKSCVSHIAVIKSQSYQPRFSGRLSCGRPAWVQKAFVAVYGGSDCGDMVHFPPEC